jgi:hypothetical protein
MSQAAQIAPAFDVRDEIRAAINRGAVDPYKIARDIARKLPPEVAREFIELRVFEIARVILSDNRTGSFAETGIVGDESVVGFNSERWRLSRVHVPGNGYVRYDDLTAEDCNALADERERTAAGWKREAKRFRALAAAINKHKVKTAGELPESVRMNILQ